MSSLPDFNKITFTPSPPVPLDELLPDASSESRELLGGFLVYASRRRMPASEALLHKYIIHICDTFCMFVSLKLSVATNSQMQRQRSVQILYKYCIRNTCVYFTVHIDRTYSAGTSLRSRFQHTTRTCRFRFEAARWPSSRLQTAARRRDEANSALPSRGTFSNTCTSTTWTRRSQTR